MISKVDICNLALGKIGDNAEVTSIDPSDGSVQASHCARLYPFALKATLESHNWGFATKPFELPELVSDFEDMMQYALPSDFLRLISLDDPSIGESNIDYTIMKHSTGVQCLTVEEEASILFYISSDVDTTHFSGLFIDLLAHTLAYYLCGPVLKGDVGVAAANKLLESMPFIKKLAVEADSKNHRIKKHYVPSGVKARRSMGFRRVNDA